jgi:hypothetical protein
MNSRPITPAQVLKAIRDNSAIDHHGLDEMLGIPLVLASELGQLSISLQMLASSNLMAGASPLQMNG